MNTEATISTLRDGDRVLCGRQFHKIRKVWRYDDKSITLEFAGNNPGLWSYPPEIAAEEYVKVKRAPIPEPCRDCIVLRHAPACSTSCIHA